MHRAREGGGASHEELRCVAMLLVASFALGGCDFIDSFRRDAEPEANSSAESSAEASAPDEAPSAAIVFGERHACSVNREGKVRCWGRNDAGQLGTAKPERRLEPADVPIPEARSIATMQDFTCAAATDGSVR
jgi:alpha-tubulin suppressor-like RCC1 family protein